MKPARGDGFCPRNVSLGPPRGENRPPRAVPRHLQDTHVTEGPEGDRLGLWAISLGVSRAMHVMERPKGKAPASGKSPLGCSSSHVPRDAPGANALTVRDSPLAGVAASVVSLGFSRVTWQARLPREVPRGTDSALETSPLVRLAAKTVPLGRSRATCHLPSATCHPVAAISSQANSPDRNANLGAQDAELCDSDKSVFPNLLRPVQRGRQRSW